MEKCVFMYVMKKSTEELCCFLCSQDIRRFFPSTAAKPAVHKPAPNGNVKAEETKKKNSKPLSPDDDVKQKKKASNKARKLT